MLVPGLQLLEEAGRRGRAVGAFNTYNLEITRAIISAAEQERAPIMLAAGQGALEFAGFDALSQLMLGEAERASVPVAVHLDHGPDLAYVGRALEAGYTSVMIDGSGLPLQENIALTRQAADMAQGVAVEGELGGVAGSEDRGASHETAIPMTDPAQARRFMDESGAGALAVAIGNAHGLYKGTPRLDLERLAAIREAVDSPLVLHGASGLGDADLAACIDLGVRKINVNTEIRVALFRALPSASEAAAGGYDVTRAFGGAISAMRDVVASKIRLFWKGVA